jgi:ABC-type lipoprotein release transport system permease subunit
MATVRNRFFVEGILLGGLCGVVLGSLIALQVGNERVTAAWRRVGRVVRGEPSVPYVHIRQ